MTWESKALRLFIRNSYQRLTGIEYPRLITDFRQRKIYQILPRDICSVLFVCKGNICRSPFAAVYCEAKLREGGSHIKVCSAGLEATAGKEAHPLAMIAAQQYTLSLQSHVTIPLTQELVNQANLILVMEQWHYTQLLQLYPEAKGKVFQLGHFNNTLATDIGDPYDGTLADFEACYRVIRQSCDFLLKYLGEMSQ